MKQRIALMYQLCRKVRRDLNQTSISSVFGRAQSTISRIEAGHLEPSARDWIKFCSLFRINPTVLIDDQLCRKTITRMLNDIHRQEGIDMFGQPKPLQGRTQKLVDSAQRFLYTLEIK